MASRVKQTLLLSVYYLCPVIASIIYWIEEPLDSIDIVNNLIHRTGSILGIFAFIWMCFNIILAIKIKLVEKNFSLDKIIDFHTRMAAISLFFMIVHYPMVRLGREYTSFQIRSGSVGFQIFIVMMVLAIIFMSNRLLKYKIIEKVRSFASGKKIKYHINKQLHSIMMLGIFIAFIHSLVSNTSRNSMLMIIVYSLFLITAFAGWVYHKILRKFQSETDPYIHRKAAWDIKIPDDIDGADKNWALNLIKQNPSLYPCFQCGSCTERCPVSRITDGMYNPRNNILSALLGRKDMLLRGNDLVIWGCTTCHSCDEICPQGIELTETFAFLKNQSIAQNNGPEFIYDQARAIFENAKAIPLQSAIEKRRDQMGLPASLKPDIQEVQTILRNLGVVKKLKVQPRE
ncbi:MAG: 4Fe-4S dicluster domain-containing protein [Promethearchaeota archaeon]|jgi:heterodisulfide reductase subunit C